MEEIILARIGTGEGDEKTSREPTFIVLSEFKGVRYLSLRKYYQENGEWKPTKKGITLNANLYSEVLSVLDQNKETISGHFNHSGTSKNA
jgi:hypothetical protein